MNIRIENAFRSPAALTRNDILQMAADWRERARMECRRAGMVQGKSPKPKHEMQGKLSNAKPRPDRDAAVLACLSDRPITAHRIQMRTGFAKSSVAIALEILCKDGKATFTAGTGRAPAQWVRV